VVSFPEPIAEWNVLLTLVYREVPGSALAFQGLVLLYFHNLGHLIRSRRRPDGYVYLLERTMLSADVFVNNMQDTPGFSAGDNRVYAEWRRRANRWVPHSVCYLTLQSDVALRRTAERGRACEVGLSSEFLRKLTGLYDKHYTRLASEWTEWERRSPQQRQQQVPVMRVVQIAAGVSPQEDIADQVWAVCATSSYDCAHDFTRSVPNTPDVGPADGRESKAVLVAATEINIEDEQECKRPCKTVEVGKPPDPPLPGPVPCNGQKAVQVTWVDNVRASPCVSL
jgi:hypothetical protein